MNPHLQRALAEDDPSGYLRYHAPRYQRVLELLSQYAAPEPAVLDIGRTRFTRIVANVLDRPVDSLGFEADGDTATGYNYRFDLNDSVDESDWRRDLPRYDLVLFCEVLEHLYTSPRQVLAFVRTLLKPDGFLILQTPNAVVLHKRVLMLLGFHPYSPISEHRKRPAHFREYTRRELAHYAAAAGFDIVERSAENYFDYRYTGHSRGNPQPARYLGLVNALYRIAPGSLRPGLCFVMTPNRRAANDATAGARPS